MKKVVCNALGGGTCNHVFEAETFEDLTEQAKQHVMSDPGHAEDAKKMMESSDEEKQQWMEMAKKVFDEQPDA
jgi:hypothetical protein